MTFIRKKFIWKPSWWFSIVRSYYEL